MKKLFKSTLMLMAAAMTCLPAWADDTHVTETRSWSFTEGSKHAAEMTDCEYWSASSKGRYALAKALTEKICMR